MSLSPADILGIWAYAGGDATGPDDAPDVHQSLLTCRDLLVDLVGTPAAPGLVPQLVKAVAALSDQNVALKAELDAVTAAVIPPKPAPAPAPVQAPGV